MCYPAQNMISNAKTCYPARKPFIQRENMLSNAKKVKLTRKYVLQHEKDVIHRENVLSYA